MDLLLSRYNNFDYLFNLDFVDGFPIIIKAMEKSNEDRLWMLWVQLYPHMDKSNYKPFSEFLEESRNSNHKSNISQTKEEIIAEAEKVKAIHQNRNLVK